MSTLHRCTRLLTSTQSIRQTLHSTHLRPSIFHSFHTLSSSSTTSTSSLLPSLTIPHFSRSYASKAPTAEEPMQSLDDVTFEWKSPVARQTEDVRSQRRRDRQKRAQVKAERGLRRTTLRRQREEERRAAAAGTDLRGIDSDKQSPVDALLPFMPAQLTETDMSSLRSLTSPLLSSARQLRALRIASLVSNYAKTEADTGSAEVQVAVLTEKLAAMARHRAQRRSDVQAIRVENRLKQRRRKLLKWLRRHNFAGFELMMKDCKIVMNEVDGVGRTEKSGNQARRPARSG